MNQSRGFGIQRAVVFKRVAKFAVILAVALSVGLHWALLQTFAWSGMVYHYAQQTTLREAVSKTFDGKHPCRLCKLVRAGQQAEQQSETLVPLVKIDSVPCATGLVLQPPVVWPEFVPVVFTAPVRVASPPFQPPRAA